MDKDDVYYHYHKDQEVQLKKVKPQLEEAANYLRLALMALDNTGDYESSLLDHVYDNIRSHEETISRMVIDYA